MDEKRTSKYDSKKQTEAIRGHQQRALRYTRHSIRTYQVPDTYRTTQDNTTPRTNIRECFSSEIHDIWSRQTSGYITGMATVVLVPFCTATLLAGVYIWRFNIPCNAPERPRFLNFFGRRSMLFLFFEIYYIATVSNAVSQFKLCLSHQFF